MASDACPEFLEKCIETTFACRMLQICPADINVLAAWLGGHGMLQG